MDEEKVYDIVMESERKENLMNIAQNNGERAQFGDKDYTDVALETCEKFNAEYDGTFDDRTIEKIKSSYDIQDENTIRLINLKLCFEQKKHKFMSIDELITFLNSAMNYDDMQIWLMKQEIKGVQLSLNEKLKKFFELKTDDDILRQYDIEQNYDQNNITEIEKVLRRTPKTNPTKN